MDIDLVISGSDPSQFGVLENILHGQFRFRSLPDSWNGIGDAQSLAFGELDGNVSWDWIAVSDKATQVIKTTTPSIGSCSPLLSNSYQHPGHSVAVADFNNDMNQDLAIASNQKLSIAWNHDGSQPFSKTTDLKDGCTSISGLSVTDLQSDGNLDIAAVIDDHISLFLATPPSDHANSFMKVRVKGISDDNGSGRVNQYAYGSVVEIYSSKKYQAQVISDATLHFGIGSDPSPYNLRVIFTNGLTQNSTNPPINTFVEEKQILRGSCRFIRMERSGV